MRIDDDITCDLELVLDDLLPEVSTSPFTNQNPNVAETLPANSDSCSELEVKSEKKSAEPFFGDHQ